MGSSDNFVHSLGDLLDIHLVAHEIWLKFSATDLLQISLVNKDWHSRSRRYLQRQFCCIQLSKNPCVALKAANEFLGTLANPIYNGIRHDRKLFATVLWPNKYYQPYACNEHCLQHQPGENLEVREIYSNVLNKLKFKFVGFRGQANEDCPFMKLIRLVLTERAHEIKELHFTGLLFNRGSVSLRSHWKIPKPENWFPNLVTLKIPKHDMDLSLELIASAPNLSKIIGSFDNSSYREWRDPDRYIPTNKMFAITVATAVGAANILHLATEVRPKHLDRLAIIATPKQDQDNSQIENSVHKLSNVVCYSLRRISCSFSTLALIANLSGVPQFHQLKYLELFNDYGHTGFKEGLDFLKSVNFKYSFPAAQEVSIHHGMCFLPPLMYEAVQDYQSTSVTGLQLNRCNWDCIPVISNIFPNVTRLQLHSIRDGVLLHLLQLNSDWGNLEELEFWSCLEDLQLDHLFRWEFPPSCQYVPRGTDYVESDESSQLYPITRGCSFFNRKCLKKLSIIGSSACFLANTLRKNTNQYLLSEETGRSVANHLPGFLIELKVELNESVHLSNGIMLMGFNFEHLKSVAEVSQSSSDVKQGIVSKNSLRIWRIQFRS